MKLVTITGRPNTGKDLVAMRLDENSDVRYIKPYTDKELPINSETYEHDGLIHLSKKQLDDKLNREVPLLIREINGSRYVFFENQLNADYIVLIVDEDSLDHLRRKFQDKLFRIYVTKSTCSRSEKYDVVFNPDTDDIDFLEVKLYE